MERNLCVAATGLLTALALSGCMSSALDSSLDAKANASGLSENTSKTVAAAALQSAPEVEIRNGDAVTTDQQAVIAAATDHTGKTARTPETATAFRSPRAAEQQMQVALNAARGSIFSTAPPKPEEAAAAQKSGVAVPSLVPAPSFNPAIATIYSAPEPQQPAADAPTAEAAHKGARLPGVGEQVEVASVITPQTQNPAAIPLPTEPPTRAFDNGRFSATSPDDNGKIEPANPLKLATPQPANPLSLTPNDGSRPVAKLNAFFPPKPSAVQSEGEGDDGAQSDDGDDGGPVGLMRLISAPGLARVAPNGIWIQTPYVETDCFKPELMKLLHTVEKHYGKPPIVTSGYRPPVWNAKAGGASHSLHTTCDAADIQVNGVSKWDLAGYLRSLPDRGGVGTYCYTNSVHIDTGAQRDWDWRCRRKSKRK